MDDSIKFYLANISAIIVSLSDVEQLLQVLVLSATLVYTLAKLYKLLKPKQ
jgi:hypothetical protein